MAWQKKNPRLYAEETSFVRRCLPDVSIEIIRGHVSLNGLFPVRTCDGSTIRQYHMVLLFPQDYPQWIPDAFMLEKNIKRIPDRHMELDGRACLCLPHEVPGFFPDGIKLEHYLNNLLRPWLVGQAYYDEHGRWPNWPTRDHGKSGILQGFAELLETDDLDAIERYARLLVRKSRAKGHEVCPCGSGRRLRDCHFELYLRCRDKLPLRVIKEYRKLFW